MIRVGTSGWSYASWRGSYYPKGLPPAEWFAHVLGEFGTVELNASFYRLPAAETFASWARRAPSGSVIAVKASRYLTHVRRLREPAEPVARLMSRAGELGPTLGPILIQLPPDARADLDALAATLRAFGPGLRLAVEFRHPSWFTEECRALLTATGAALVWADRRGRPTGPLWRTAGWGYLRLHEGASRAWPAYGDAALRSWADRLLDAFGAPGNDAYAYFNNDPNAAAPADAARFARLLARRAGFSRP